MKQYLPLTICLLIVASQLQAQNSFPATGRTGINTVIPAATLQVKGGVRMGTADSYMAIDSATGNLRMTGVATYLIGLNRYVFMDSVHKTSGLRYTTATYDYEWVSAQ